MRLRAPLGFTLLELVATVGIVGGLTAAALPLAHALHADRAQSELNSAFASSLEQARARAIADGQPVNLCASGDGETCESRDWSVGWRLYRGEVTLASYQVERPLPLAVVDTAAGTAYQISFNAQGFTTGDRAFHIHTCDAGKPLTLQLERNGRLGRASSGAAPDSQCEG